MIDVYGRRRRKSVSQSVRQAGRQAGVERKGPVKACFAFHGVKRATRHARREKVVPRCSEIERQLCQTSGLLSSDGPHKRDRGAGRTGAVGPIELTLFGRVVVIVVRPKAKNQ